MSSLRKFKPYFAAIFLQFGLAGMDVLSKAALNQAMSNFAPVIGQNLYYVGMYTTATFAAAMYNILPAITFLMACIFRLEKVNFRSIRNHAKVIGTHATVAGAMVITLMKGPVMELLWTKSSINNQEAESKKGTDFHHTCL
ncbi:Detected protein of unknown function [Hibiscus syriacus]|uniref:WAT1-related protein n=1 Tax=Hibiscus syriacus TaxID=106335 RepID=A0A6A3D2G2_HIBSY|nr:Detected protein of unknown function [Hibiscus syriacus]